MTVQVEQYRREEALESEKDAEAARRAELLESLGFSPELQLVTEKGDEAACFYPELEGFELSVWTLFHTSYYSFNRGDWSGYHFDRVPTDVLEEIRFAKEFGGFDDIELWTPEKKRDLDPMAVGVVGHRLGDRHLEYDLGRNFAFNLNARFFPIVRWGESLLPIDGIKHRALLNAVLPGYNWNRSEIPAGVLRYVEERLRAGARGAFELQKPGFLSGNHCGQGLVKVRFGSSETHVCAVCGA